MTDDRDPTLQALFASAEQDLAREAFTAQLMLRVDKLKRRKIMTWICIDLLLVACAWLLATPLQTAVNFLIPGLSTSLIGLDNRLLAELLLPVNNVASLLALLLIGVRSTYRRLIS